MLVNARFLVLGEVTARVLQTPVTQVEDRSKKGNCPRRSHAPPGQARRMQQFYGLTIRNKALPDSRPAQ